MFSSRQFLSSSIAVAAAAVLVGCSAGVKPKTVEKQDEPAPKAKPAERANAEIDPNAKGPFKRVFLLVDKQKAMEENPNYVETVNTIEAGDYFTGVAQGAFAAASKTTTISLQYYVRLHEAQHGKNPTLEEIKKYLKDNGVTLKGLYPYQVYAYDEETATICILEDKAERAKREGN